MTRPSMSIAIRERFHDLFKPSPRLQVRLLSIARAAVLRVFTVWQFRVLSAVLEPAMHPEQARIRSADHVPASCSAVST